MAKRKKKNGNYQTEARENARREAEATAAAEKRSRRNKAIFIPLISVLLVGLTLFGILSFNAGWYGPDGLGWYGHKVTHYATIIIKDYGTITLELYGEEAPETVANFEKLANEGYYDGTTFHRIIEDFMAQGGEGDGTAATIKGEFSENGVKNKVKHKRGTISMARTNVYNSASSQFFIVHKTSEKNTESLDGLYAAFGRVIDDGTGYAVLDKLCATDYDAGYNGMIDESKQPIILSVSVKPKGAD